MPLDKSFDNVVTLKEESKKEITRLTVLDEKDKNTIYNLIFIKAQEESKGK